MGCCGEKVGRILSKTGQIAAGYTKLAVSRPATKEEEFEFPEERVRICQQCEFGTWLKYSEFIGWLREQGIAVITHLDELEKLPMLPKYEKSDKRKNLFCRICKCFIPAKARLKNSKCDKGKW